MNTKVREAVFRRADGRCEAFVSTGPPYRCTGPSEVLDHFLGGIGRRRQLESVATCWALCVVCDRDRTRNWPSAAYWNDSFELHCAAHGYPFKPHITHAKVTR